MLWMFCFILDSYFKVQCFFRITCVHPNDISDLVCLMAWFSPDPPSIYVPVLCVGNSALQCCHNDLFMNITAMTPF